MDLLRPCYVVCSITAMASHVCQEIGVLQVSGTGSLKVVVLADISAVVVRGFSRLNSNSLRPPAQ